MSESITAVVAVYNGAQHLYAALESIIRQTKPVSEIIVVNDGSTDDSSEVINHFFSINKTSGLKTVLIEKENGGQGSARNLGIEKANSDFIALLDQDDTWEPNHIELLLAPFVNNPVLGWVYSDFNEFDEGDRYIRRNFLQKAHYVVPDRSIFGLIEADLMMLPSASLIRKKALDDIGGFDLQFRGYEDDDLFIRMFVKGWDFEFLTQATLNYRIHPDNSSRQLTFPNSRIAFYRKYKNFFEGNWSYQEKFFHSFLANRMTQAAIRDAAVAARDKNKEAKDLATQFAREISLDAGMKFKNRILLFVIQIPWLLRLALWVRQSRKSFKENNQQMKY